MIWPFNRKTTTPTPTPAPAASLAQCVRAGKAFARGFDAARQDRHTEGWYGDFGISQWDIRHQLRVVRNRSREMWKNDPYLTRWGAICRNNIIGADGMQLIMDVADYGRDNKTGEWTKRPDKMANEIIQNDFKRWASNPEYVDTAKRKDLAMMEWHAVIDWHREGEALFRLHPGFGYPENPFAFSLSRIRPDQLALEYSMEMSNGDKVYNGVHVDKWGAAKGYWFYTVQLATGIWSGDKIYIPADEIVHIYDEDYEGQTRGFPLVACVLRSIKMLYGYDEAELIKARLQSMNIGTWQLKDGAVSPDEIADPEDEDTRAQFEQTWEPGQSRISPQGYEYREAAPTAPNVVYPAYHMELVRRIAGGLETAYHSLANDPSNVNMNAGRLASLEDRESWKVKQHMLQVMMLRPIFSRPRAWLSMYLSSGVSPLPFSKRARFDKPTWRGRRWPAYDLNGEVTYNEWAVKHAITTDTTLAAENGENRAANLATVRQEMKDESGTPIADRFEGKTSLAAKAGTPPNDGSKKESTDSKAKGE
ncbi:MAG: phage portal protein [Gallionella sp.]